MAFRVSVRKASLTLKRPEFDVKAGLVTSPLLPWVPVAVDSSEARRAVEAEARVDGVEVVEWMTLAGADNAVFSAMEEEYRRLGSRVLTGSGDPFLPGLRVGDLRIASGVRGSTIRERGYAEVQTPQGSFRIPVGGKATFAKGDILAWGAVPWVGLVQYLATLVQWIELARVPVRSRVRFPSSYGLVAPQFFKVAPRAPVPLVTLRIGVTSDTKQVIAVRGRGAEGRYEHVYFEDAFEVEQGESEVVYNVFGIPFVPAFTLEIAPADNTQTVLDYIEVFPPV